MGIGLRILRISTGCNTSGLMLPCGLQQLRGQIGGASDEAGLQDHRSFSSGRHQGVWWLEENLLRLFFFP